jgi:anti-sigma B factor antagonist
MRTDVHLHAGAVTIRMCGELDLATTEQLAAAVELHARTPWAGLGVTLDLTGVTFIDSTGLREILRAHAVLGSRLLVLPSDACSRLFRMAGVESRLPIEIPGSGASIGLDGAGTGRLRGGS